ncbi:glycosyltransferase [Ascidiaceihabitans sp.]|uniref:glycosyltransferase n=1 Tax=Ascidiaceihabitans sp. TaxID=1872644 RepID=UPI003299F8F8
MTYEFDLSVVVTAHSETFVCGPTMRAADASIDAARAAGFSVQAIIALDNATPQTAAYFNQAAFDHWDRVVLTQGDLGRARNEMVTQHTKGSAIAFLDADDLFSENWLAEGMKRLRTAQARGERVIVHPELNWLFDAAASVYWNPEQDDPLWTPYYLYTMNYYDSLCLVPHEAHLEVPYVHRDIPNGLSFQDWQFSIETLHAGWRHAVARDTIIFKRRRDNSLVTESQGRRAIVRSLEAMRIDKVASLGAATQASPALTVTTPCAVPDPMPVAQMTVDPKTVVTLSPEEAQKVAAGEMKAPLPPVLRGRNPPLPNPLPHYGAIFAQRVAQGLGRAEHRTGAPVYPTVQAQFDVAYYLARYRDLARAPKLDPVGHWLRAGSNEGRMPNHWFDPKRYLARYEDVRKSKVNPFYHFLTQGRDEGRIAAPFPQFDAMAALVGLDPDEAQQLWIARYTDLRTRLESGDLGAQVTAAARFDPLVEATWAEALQIKVAPFHTAPVVNRTVAMHRAHAQADHRPAKAVIMVNRPRWGGARRMEGHLADALVARYGADQVVVVSTDASGDMPAHKFPDGVRHVDLQSCIEGKLKGDLTERLLVEFLRSLAPEVAFNVNSRLMWDALNIYGNALAASMRLYGCLFCNERTPMGYLTGYPLRRFYRTFDVLSGVFTDSAFLADELRTAHVLPPEAGARVQVLRGPVDHSVQVVDAPAPVLDATSDAAPRRPRIFWAGRMDAQKRIDLVFDIARSMPEADFHLWGETVMGGQSLPAALPNMTLNAPYARFADLPLDEADMWLYTAAWDGIPQMLLEVGMTGLPVVSSTAGGTPEVIRDGLGTLLPKAAGAPDYVAAIRAVLADPAEARTQGQALRRSLIETHTKEAYAQALGQVLDMAPAR